MYLIEQFADTTATVFDVVKFVTTGFCYWLSVVCLKFARWSEVVCDMSSVV